MSSNYFFIFSFHYFRFSFVESACNDPTHLDQVSGLKKIRDEVIDIDLDDMLVMSEGEEDD